MLPQRAIVELPPMAQSGYQSRTKLGRLTGRRKNMVEFLRKTGSHGRLADIAEYVVMLLVTLMTGVSTLRLLGILP
jgi:hypothetical protein